MILLGACCGREVPVDVRFTRKESKGFVKSSLLRTVLLITLLEIAVRAGLCLVCIETRFAQEVLTTLCAQLSIRCKDSQLEECVLVKRRAVPSAVTFRRGISMEPEVLE